MRTIPALASLAILLGCFGLVCYYPEWDLFMSTDRVKSLLVFLMLVVIVLFFRKYGKENGDQDDHTILLRIGNKSVNESMTLTLFTEKAPHYVSNLKGTRCQIESTHDGSEISDVLKYLKENEIEKFTIRKLSGNKLNRIDIATMKMSRIVEKPDTCDTVRQLEFGQWYPAYALLFNLRAQRIVLTPGEKIAILFRMKDKIGKSLLHSVS